MPAKNNDGDVKEGGAISPADMAMHKERLSSDSDTFVLESVRFFRMKLSVIASPPIRPVVEAGLLPEFVRLLEKHDNAVVRYEAAWCLTNVASGDSEMTRAVVDVGALPIFTSLISLESALSAVKDNALLCEQCVWAVGNICGDGTAMRNLVIDAGAPQRVAAILAQAAEVTEKPLGGIPLAMLRNAAWCASNIFRGKPKPAYEAPLVDLLRAIAGLVTVEDEEARIDIIWGLSYACEIDPEGAAEIAERVDVSAIVDIARDPAKAINARTPALRILGNLVSCAEEITQAVVDADGVAAFFSIALEGGVKKALQKEALWSLSNVAAGTKSQSMAVALHPQMQELCMRIPALPADCLKEGLWVISNACQCKDAQVIDAVIAGGGMAALVKGLSLPDAKAKMVALEGLDCILSSPPSDDAAAVEDGAVGARAAALEAIGGLEALEACQHDEHPAVYNLALRILESHFHIEVEGGEKDEAEDEEEEGDEDAGQRQGADALNSSVEAIQLDDD